MTKTWKAWRDAYAHLMKADPHAAAAEGPTTPPFGSSDEDRGVSSVVPGVFGGWHYMALPILVLLETVIKQQAEIDHLRGVQMSPLDERVGLLEGRSGAVEERHRRRTSLKQLNPPLARRLN